MQPDLETVRAKSLTAYYLWIWVHSVENYHEIYKGIKPWNQKLLRTKTGSVSLIEQNEKTQQLLEENQDQFVKEREAFIKASMQANVFKIVVEQLERKLQSLKQALATKEKELGLRMRKLRPVKKSFVFERVILDKNQLKNRIILEGYQIPAPDLSKARHPLKEELEISRDYQSGLPAISQRFRSISNQRDKL